MTRLRVVTEAGRTVTCWSCINFDRCVTHVFGCPVAGQCELFPDITHDTKTDATRHGCTFWERRGRE